MATTVPNGNDCYERELAAPLYLNFFDNSLFAAVELLVYCQSPLGNISFLAFRIDNLNNPVPTHAKTYKPL